MACRRPDLNHCTSLAGLYSVFVDLFLRGNETMNVLKSASGHTITVFDHNFFHMVKLDDPLKSKPLLMVNEKGIILGTTEGFGPYTYDKQRAIYLASALSTLLEPDEVWEDEGLNTADWVYLKEFDTMPYSHTIFLVAHRKQEGHIVPVTSYPARPRDVRKRRKRTQIYP